MKTFKIFLLYSFLMLFLTNGSCKKPDIPTGDHTFSCFIDGKLFVPKGNSSFSDGPFNDGLSFLRYDTFFSGSAKDFKEYTVFFNIKDFATGTFNLKASNGSFYDNSYSHAIVRHNNVYYLSKENSGSVTFSEAADNVVGTFEFTLYNENNENDIIRVTNGNFDN